MLPYFQKQAKEVNALHDVFISYSTKDMLQAETVRDVLEKNGIPCWMAPRDIPGGSNYAGEIPRAIRGCQVFLLILSENAQASNWVVKELDNAVNCGKIIIPLMLEDCPLNDEFNFLLTGAQRYAAYQKRAEVLNTLVERIRAVTGTKPEPRAEAASVQPAAAVEAPQVPVAPKTPAVTAAAKARVAPAAPKESPKKESGPKSAAVPVVHRAKPQKPKKVKEKIPFVFGRTEALAALAIPGMALVSVLGYLVGNNMYMATTYPLQYGFGDIVLYSRNYKMLALYVLIGMLLGALLWWEWIRFRHRELAGKPETPVCPACGSDQLGVSTFRTRRMTWPEWATLLLVPLCMAVSLYAHPVGMVLLSSLFNLRFVTFLDSVGVEIIMTGLSQALAVGLWLSNMLVRRMRRRKGLGSTVCRCKDCRASFLPVAKK